jgi:putative two-component system response regulator
MQTTDPVSILVVDDEVKVQKLIVHILERVGYTDVKVASSNDEARSILKTGSVELILTDMQMPGGTGMDLLTFVHETLPEVATLMITGVDDPGVAEKALDLGAYGYLIKPFRVSEVVIGVRNALKRRSLEKENRDHRDHLEERVRLRTAHLWTAVNQLERAHQDIRKSRTETIERLAFAAEYRDQDPGRHVIQMSRYCELLARETTPPADELAASIRDAASLHDVGKIGVPDKILSKPGTLSPEERCVMETHARIGHSILGGSRSPVLQLAAEIALTHHEWVDGTGYPEGLLGLEIPLSGRIAAIADVFDALTTDRQYRHAYPFLEAVRMMKIESGTHLDAELLETFWGLMPEILRIKEDQLSEAVA